MGFSFAPPLIFRAFHAMMGGYSYSPMLQPSFEQSPKKKSSSEKSTASGEIGGKEEVQGGFEIGADRVGVDKHEAGVRAEIAEKEKTRDSLIKAYSKEFKDYVAKREEREAAMALLESQRISGASKVTDEQMEAFRANDAALDAEDLRHAEAYKRDAADLEKEIDALKDRLERGSN